MPNKTRRKTQKSSATFRETFRGYDEGDAHENTQLWFASINQDSSAFVGESKSNQVAVLFCFIRDKRYLRSFRSIEEKFVDSSVARMPVDKPTERKSIRSDLKTTDWKTNTQPYRMWVNSNKKNCTFFGNQYWSKSFFLARVFGMFLFTLCRDKKYLWASDKSKLIFFGTLILWPTESLLKIVICWYYCSASMLWNEAFFSFQIVDLTFHWNFFYRIKL